MALTESRAGGIRLMVDRADGASVAFSDRVGGVSDPPFDTLNLAIRVGDRRDLVDVNRGRVAKAAGFEPAALALTRQVHGADVIEAREGDSGVLGEADVLVTSAPGVTIGILTADCAPVVLAGRGRAAIAHAGWRGVARGAVERALDTVGHVSAAWIGPSIHSCCYTVGAEVIESFAAKGLTIPAEGRVDPARAAAEILVRSGVGEVLVSDVCTSCDARYFSHRRDGLTGRQGGFVTLER